MASGEHHDALASEAEETSEIRALLRNSGLKCTAPRVAVMKYLRRAEAPLTHAELAQALVPLGLDAATIYRNLVNLSEAGLLTRLEPGDRLCRFELAVPSHPRRELQAEIQAVDLRHQQNW